MMTSSIRRFLQNQDGATAIEYAFIAGMIATAIVGSVLLLGTRLEAAYQAVVDLF